MTHHRPLQNMSTIQYRPWTLPLLIICAQVITSTVLPAWKWRGIDAGTTLLNLSGALMAGIVKGGISRRSHGWALYAQSFSTGFLAVWTSLLFTVEHAAHLAVVVSFELGVVYLLASMLVAPTLYIIGFKLSKGSRETAISILLAGAITLLAFFSAKEVDENMVPTVCQAETCGDKGGNSDPSRIYIPVIQLDKMIWGIAMAMSGAFGGNWFANVNGGNKGRIKWGNWRCNALSFAVTVTIHRAIPRLHPMSRSLLRSTAFTTVTSEGLGCMSGFASMAEDVGDLVLAGDLTAALQNLALNAVTATVALLARMKAGTVP